MSAIINKRARPPESAVIRRKEQRGIKLALVPSKLGKPTKATGRI